MRLIGFLLLFCDASIDRRHLPCCAARNGGAASVTGAKLCVRRRLALIALALTGPAFADEAPVYSAGEIIVTASRTPQKLSDTLQAVTVISAKDIAESGQHSLTEVLQTLGGVEITSNGGLGQTSNVFMRGANSAHTLVLIDGIRLASATAGTTAFENIPIAQVERIEIVPGPLSGLYGSDAIGGVIQVFTRSGGHGPVASMTAGAGTYNTRSVSASLSHSLNDTDFALSAGYLESDSFDATKRSLDAPGCALFNFCHHNPDKDGYRNSNFSAQVAHRFNPDNELGATALYSDGRTHFDSGPATDDVNHQTLSAYSLYSRNQVTSSWESLLRLGMGRDHSVIAGSIPGEIQTDQDQATWQNTFQLGLGSLLAGAEYLRQKVTGDTTFAVSERTIRSVFGGFRGDYGDHGIQANLRRDDNSQFGDPTTGSLGYGYRLTPELKLRAAYGKAFHAPTFNDLYFPGFGNPDLKPERSRNREAGFDYQTARQRFSATYYDNRISDLILFVFDPLTFSGAPQNAAGARIRGTELSYTGNIFATQVRAKLTLQDPKDEQSGFQLQRRAKRFGSVAIAYPWGAWKLGAEVVASGERFDSVDENPASRLAGYALLNMFASYNISSEWSVQARWNNATDKGYELVRNYNTPGSNVFVSVTWTPVTSP